ncbi:ATP-binding cassette domain-containing protein [Nocardioides sp. Y6]|uniref:ATP-binding cassette domain-containing protein n=1 Tax=Nocardioides malaquae TaxID=2773426 RepID=A0ABR9RXH7_9ACTN|nr:ATP-binding cassette domain-containing protein [Nocardioides malaquae]MBE7325860.1 ATP-binding cassette domain-containing protein [Nocardioides malaquae]
MTPTTPHSRTDRAAIRTRGLTKRYTSHGAVVHAVDGLDLEVGQGELVAFLGPNGAGKTTTLRMLTTLIPPTAGSATVAGFDVVAEQRQVRRSIGYVGQGNGAGHQQLGRDELISQGRAYGLGRRRAHERADELIADLDLTAVARRKVSSLSGGQRRRLDIAMGLVHLPRILFLDEPSTGLDPQNRANLQGLVERLHAETGSTVVLTTHYLEEADALAERVVVIDRGRVIADDTASRLKGGLGDHVVLTFTDADAATQAAPRVATAGEDAELTQDGAVLRLLARGAHTEVPGLLVDLDRQRLAARSVEVTRPTLDDVFLQITGRSLREANEETPDGTDGPGTHETTKDGVAA